VTHRDVLKASLDEAVLIRSRLNRTKVDGEVTYAANAYREAILLSQLHSFTGMVFGRSTTEVTDQEIHQFLRIFVFLPAIFVAFASTLIAFTSVHKVDPDLIPFDPEGTEYLLKPIYESVVGEAVQAAERAARSATTRKQAATAGATV
jgi:hypothetical protein